jgi:ribosome maturation factor RimP
MTATVSAATAIVRTFEAWLRTSPLRVARGSDSFAGSETRPALLPFPSTTFHRFGEMGARRPFLVMEAGLAKIHDTERELQREISARVERALPGVEVLAVELSSPDRFCVYVDHPEGVDHALCERVTSTLRDYLDRYTIDVSSPGVQRPLRKPAHFRNAVGRRVALRTDPAVGGRTRFRGALVAADDRAVTVEAGNGGVYIPYEVIVRGNLIDEVS